MGDLFKGRNYNWKFGVVTNIEKKGKSTRSGIYFSNL